MLVDLETAKVELDLANERAAEAQQQASGLRVALAASEQKCAVLEGQLNTTQAKCVHWDAIHGHNMWL
jgi:hypothetical protein